MPLKRSSSLNDAFRRRNSQRREAGRMSATEMGAGLVKAIRCGDEAWLSALLAAGAPPNARDEGGRPILYLLLESSAGSPEVCKMLLERGALPDLPVPETGQTALHAAARKGFQVCIGQLLSETANPDQPDLLGNSPLMYACANGHDPSARMLIKAGAFAGRVNSRGETGLHLASKQGSLGCVKEMLAASCPVNCLDQRGLSPLLIASITNQPAIVHLLLDHASNVNDQDPLTGRTALHWTVIHRDPSTATKLIRSGIDLDLRDADWNTAFLIAANLGDRQMARLLVDAGCDVSVTDKSFNTALHLSSRDGHEELIPIFVESGLNLDLKGPGGLTPLMLAAFGGHEKVVRVLLTYGARPKMLDRNRASALIYALLSNASSQECVGSIVKCLVQFNVDVDESANLVGLSRAITLPREIDKATLEDRLYSPVEVAYLRGSSYLCGLLVRAGCDLSVFCAPSRGSRAPSGRSPAVINRDLLQRLVQHARRQRRIVPSLLELCRRPVLKRIAQMTSLARLEDLALPDDLTRFLRYEDLDSSPRSKPATVPVAEPNSRMNHGSRWNQSRNTVAEPTGMPSGTPLGTLKPQTRIRAEPAAETNGMSHRTQLRQSRSRMDLVSEPKSLGSKSNPPQFHQAFERNDPRRRTIAEAAPRNGTGSSRLNLHRKPIGSSDYSQDHQNPPANHQNSTGTSTSGSSGSATPRSFSSREASLRLTKPRTTDYLTRVTTPSAHGTLRTKSRAKSSSNLSRPRVPQAPQGSAWELSSRVRTPLNTDRTRSDPKTGPATPWR